MDGWQRIVGVPIDAWIAADTIEKFADLLDRRDNPRPCTVEHRTVDVFDFVGVKLHTVRAEPCNGDH